MKLNELGCFKNISVFIDTSKGPKSTPDGLEVSYMSLHNNKIYNINIPR